MNTSILNRNGQIDINQCIEENAKAVKVVGKLKLHKKSGDIGGLVHVKIRLQQLGDQRNGVFIYMVTFKVQRNHITINTT